MPHFYRLKIEPHYFVGLPSKKISSDLETVQKNADSPSMLPQIGICCHFHAPELRYESILRGIPHWKKNRLPTSADITDIPLWWAYQDDLLWLEGKQTETDLFHVSSSSQMIRTTESKIVPTRPKRSTSPNLKRWVDRVRPKRLHYRPLFQLEGKPSTKYSTDESEWTRNEGSSLRLSCIFNIQLSTHSLSYTR